MQIMVVCWSGAGSADGMVRLWERDDGELAGDSVA